MTLPSQCALDTGIAHWEAFHFAISRELLPVLDRQALCGRANQSITEMAIFMIEPVQGQKEARSG